jgi:photosystem II stability/assembly factor-like uncharacterized protein
MKGIIYMRNRFLLLIIVFTASLHIISYSQNYWTQTNGPSVSEVYCIDVSPHGYVFAGTVLDGGVYRSPDLGESWEKVFTNASDTGVFSIAVNSIGYIFAGTCDGKVYRSIDDGDNWTPVYTDPDRFYISSLLVKTIDTVFFSINTSVYRSTNNGANWQLASAGLPRI